jgi:putative transcriptional regulator
MNLDISQTSQQLVKGHLLVAQPFLPDPHFERSVVLVCEHGEQGAFGFVLSKATELQVAEVIEVSSFDQTLYVGGPMEQNTLHFIHKLPEIPNALLLKDGVYWGGDFEYVKSLAIANRLQPKNSRFFIGYSGWGKEQLQNELKENSWFVAETNLNVIFENESDKLWQVVLKNMGGKYKAFANYPKDPKLN